MITEDVHKKYRQVLSGANVEEAIRRYHGLPDDAKISITVPGGGDWSGESLEPGEFREIAATWEIHEISESEE